MSENTTTRERVDEMMRGNGWGQSCIVVFLRPARALASGSVLQDGKMGRSREGMGSSVGFLYLANLVGRNRGGGVGGRREEEGAGVSRRGRRWGSGVRGWPGVEMESTVYFLYL